jgi:dipeptidyl aminopeptidase/acylaminoacyl peptidase
MRLGPLIGTLLAVPFAVATASADSIPAFGPDSLFDWKFVGDARISPTGQRVAYVLATVDKERDDYATSILLVEGKAAPRVLTGGPSDRAPRWSPDGTRLAFLSNRSGKPQVHVIELRGGEAWQLTADATGVQDFTWSPDSKQIAFRSRTPLPGEAGYEQAEKARQSKDSERVRSRKAFVTERLQYRMEGITGFRDDRRTHIWVVALDGGARQAARRVTRGDFNHGQPAWSADSTQLYFSAIRTADAEYSEDSEIYAVAADGNDEPRALTDRRGVDADPLPSPDGKWIAYLGSDARTPVVRSRDPNNLYIMRTDGSEVRQLAASLDRNVGEVGMNDMLSPRANGATMAWSPDSRRVLFLSSDRGQTHLYEAPVASGDHSVLTRFPQGIVGDFSIDRAGRVAAVFSAPTKPGEVYAFDLKDAGTDRWQALTSHNAKIGSATQFSPYEELWYDSFDGKRIQSWLIKPPGFDPARKYPFVLYVHGGPHFMYATGFFHELQVLAQAGYLVLISNPRGSTGYGLDFTNIVERDYPKDDYKDLMTAVDRVVERGYIDEKRMGIAGGSYGGVMSSWTIGHTDRFAAAVVERAVTNWHSFVGAADKNLYFATHWFPDMPWRIPEHYIARSPLTYVDNVKTPVLVVHSMEDYSTTLEQGLQYYAALKMMKKPARLVVFPESNHGLSRSGPPSQRVERLELIRGWFDEHLKQ